MSKIDKIINSGYTISLGITGGGTRAISMLLENGGASKVLYDAYVPYSYAALESFLLRYPLTQAVCEKTAEYFASEMAYALKVIGSNKKFGLSCTAKLYSKGEREGREHKAYICAYQDKVLKFWEFIPSTKTRKEQEDELSEFILDCILEIIN